MRFKSNMTAIVGIGVLLIMGCARQTEVVKLYEDPDAAQKTYQRLLVVSVSDARREQENFENAITEQLRQNNIEAVPSHTLFSAEQGLLEEDINRAVEQTGADGLLITHIAGVDSTAEVREGREDIVAECRGGDLAEYFMYDYKVLRQPDSVRLSHTVIVIANLYEVDTFERVWGIQSTCFDKETMTEVISDEAEAIARQLRIDQLI